MADTATLAPQPKKEIRRQGIMGLLDDTVGFFEQAGEATIYGKGDFITEGPVREGPADLTLEQARQLPKLETGFPSKGSLENFKEPNGAPKTAEQALIEQRAIIIAETGNRHRISHEEFVIQEEVRLGIQGMPEDLRNKKLNLNTSYKLEHTKTTYHDAWLERIQKMEELQSEEQTDKAAVSSPAKKDLSMNLEDIEGGSNISAGAAASGKVG